VTRPRSAGGTFAALHNPNFRLYFIGHAVSQGGTWMQNVAQAWLVYSLTGSGTALGAVVALQALPTMLFASYGGVVADRMDKRRLVMIAQTFMGVLALVLGLLTLAGTVQVWHVYVLAFLLGIARTFEIPARQAFLMEMVGREDLRNAVSLNSLLPNLARTLGPALAGVLIASVGTGACFLLNAASYMAIVVTFLMMDVTLLHPSERAARARGQLREGIRYAFSTPSLAVPLAMTTVIGCFAVQWPVVMTVVAKETFDGGPRTLGFLMASLGAGAIVGALLLARHGHVGVRALTTYSMWFAAALALAALAPDLPLAFVAMALVGAAAVAVMSSTNATLQLVSEPRMRGRVIALWLVAVDGINAVGGPAVGAIGEHAGGRVALLVGAGSCVLAAGIGLRASRRQPEALRAPEARPWSSEPELGRSD
jgi:MFS family permease